MGQQCPPPRPRPLRTRRSGRFHAEAGRGAHLHPPRQDEPSTDRRHLPGPADGTAGRWAVLAPQDEVRRILFQDDLGPGGLRSSPLGKPGCYWGS